MLTKTETFKWHIKIPSTTTLMWQFNFVVRMYPNDAQRMVVHVHSPTTGSVRFSVPNTGTGWKSAFRAYQRCVQIALDHAREWNELDDIPW